MPTGAELGILVTSLKVAVVVYDFLEIAGKFSDAPEDSRGMRYHYGSTNVSPHPLWLLINNLAAFLRLLLQVETDFQYAVRLREENLGQLQRQYSLQEKWIRDVLVATLQEMNDFGRFVQKFDDVNLPTFTERAKFLLRNHKSLTVRAESLHGAHNRLLACINGLHTITVQIQVRDALLGETKGMILSPCSNTPSVLKARQSRAFRGRASRRAPESDDEDDDDDCEMLSPACKEPEAAGNPFSESPPGHGEQN